MSIPAPPKNQRLISPRFRNAAERVHALGPRCVAELLAEVGADLDLVEQYARLDELPAEFLITIGACGWPPDLFEVAL